MHHATEVAKAKRSRDGGSGNADVGRSALPSRAVPEGTPVYYGLGRSASGAPRDASDSPGLAMLSAGLTKGRRPATASRRP